MKFEFLPRDSVLRSGMIVASITSACRANLHPSGEMRWNHAWVFCDQDWRMQARKKSLAVGLGLPAHSKPPTALTGTTWQIGCARASEQWAAALRESSEPGDYPHAHLGSPSALADDAGVRQPGLKPAGAQDSRRAGVTCEPGI